MPKEPIAVETPKYPVGELTTYELKTYRGQLQRALADKEIGSAPIATALRRRLDAVLAEEAERAGNRGNVGNTPQIAKLAG